MDLFLLFCPTSSDVTTNPLIRSLNCLNFAQTDLSSTAIPSQYYGSKALLTHNTVLWVESSYEFQINLTDHRLRAVNSRRILVIVTVSSPEKSSSCNKSCLLPHSQYSTSYLASILSKNMTAALTNAAPRKSNRI